MPDTDVELHQFRYSHFNEKARWALDFKRVPHMRTSYLPGPHQPKIRKLTGQTQTPVVRFGDDYLYGSARIIDELEKRYPSPPLYPEDGSQRIRALEIQSWFDSEIGPRGRRAVLNSMMGETAYFANMFSEGQTAGKRCFYRTILPLAKGKIRRGNDITGPESVADGVAALQEGFDFVAREAGAAGYLVGDTFSVADLTAAAILAPVADPPDCEMTRPRPVPAVVAEFIARFADHPGREWVLEMYRRHRGATAEIATAAV